MELNEFVKQSLTQIAQGVKNSQEEIRDMGGFANPAVLSDATGQASATHFGSVGDGQNVLLVDFDVALTVSDATELGAGGKLFVASIFKAEAGRKNHSINESTSRIQFKVPLALPVDPLTKQKLDQELAAQRCEADNYNRNLQEV